MRSATDFVQKLPAASGLSINENLNTIGDGRTEIDLRGLYSKETLVLQDGRRLATDGFAGYEVGLNFFFSPTVDLNLFPLGLIDHIDILKDGASAIYGSDAVGGVFNVSAPQSRDTTEVLEPLRQRHIPDSPPDIGLPLVVAVFDVAQATNGGSWSNTLFMPSVMVVLLSHARQPHELYSAVETGMTFLSLPSFISTFLPASLA